MLWFRTLLVLSFAIFWGGLTFYTGVVVRISHDVLINPMDGGLITQRVTIALQWLGVVTAFLLAINAWQVRKQSVRLGNALAACCLLLSISLAGLFFVHGQLDAVIDVTDGSVTDQAAFDDGHRHYNQLTTVEWLSTFISLPLTVFAWQRCDGRRNPDDD